MGKLIFCVLCVYSFIAAAQGSLLCTITPSNPSCKAATQQPFCVANGSSSLPPCSVTADSLAAGRAQAGSSDRSAGLIPSWVNITLAQQGQAFAQKNIFSVLISHFYALLSILTIPDIKNVLLFTSNSDTAMKALKRYIATSTQVLLWYNVPLSTDADANAWFVSINNVRQRHLNAAKASTAHGAPLYAPGTFDNVSIDDAMWLAVSKDLNSSNINASYRNWSPTYSAYNNSPAYINQFAQAVTQFGFVAYSVIRPDAIYLWNAANTDIQGFVHLWAIIGYALGIDDEFNICLKPDLPTVRSQFEQILQDYYTPALFQIDRDTKVLVEATLASLNVYYPTYFNSTLLPPWTPKAGFTFILRMIRDIWQIPVPNQMANLDPIDLGFETAWDNLVVPSTRIPGDSAVLGGTLEGAVQAGILGLFGPYVTNMDKAQNVFYSIS